jgi:hypothetical protein
MTSQSIYSYIVISYPIVHRLDTPQLVQFIDDPMADDIDDLIFAGWYSHCPKQRRLDRSEFCVDFEERDAIGAKSKDFERRLGDLGMDDSRGCHQQ